MMNSMKSKERKIIEIFLVLFVLSIIVSVSVYAEWKEKENIIKSTKICADMDEIECIVYTRGTKIRKLVKQNDVWVWEDKTELVVDQVEVEEKIEDLLQVTAIDKVKDVQESEDSGVDEPSYSIALTDINQKTKTVSLGKTTGENNYYVKIDDQKEIYIVTEEIKEIIISLDSDRNIREQMDAISSPTRR